MKKALKWTGNIIFTLLLVMMVILVFFTVSSKFSQDGSSKLASYQLMVVLSGSMSPEFNAGDVVVVDAKKKTQYNKGEVITFKDPQDQKKVVTHRIAEVLQNGDQISYRTKGDANNTADSKPVPAANIIGQQKWHIPYLGRVVEFAKTKQGIVLLVVIPGILIIVGEFRRIAKVLTEEVEKRKREIVPEPAAKE